MKFLALCFCVAHRWIVAVMLTSLIEASCQTVNVLVLVSVSSSFDCSLYRFTRVSMCRWKCAYMEVTNVSTLLLLLLFLQVFSWSESQFPHVCSNVWMKCDQSLKHKYRFFFSQGSKVIQWFRDLNPVTCFCCSSVVCVSRVTTASCSHSRTRSTAASPKMKVSHSLTSCHI